VFQSRNRKIAKPDEKSKKQTLSERHAQKERGVDLVVRAGIQQE